MKIYFASQAYEMIMDLKNADRYGQSYNHGIAFRNTSGRNVHIGGVISSSCRAYYLFLAPICQFTMTFRRAAAPPRHITHARQRALYSRR